MPSRPASSRQPRLRPPGRPPRLLCHFFIVQEFDGECFADSPAGFGREDTVVLSTTVRAVGAATAATRRAPRSCLVHGVRPRADTTLARRWLPCIQVPTCALLSCLPSQAGGDTRTQRCPLPAVHVFSLRSRLFFCCHDRINNWMIVCIMY